MTDWSSGIPKREPKLGRIEVSGGKRPKTGVREELDRVSSSITPSMTPAEPEPAPPPTILGIEASERLGLVTVLLKEGSFDARQFGPVTLVLGAQRFFLRYSGTSQAPQGQVGFTLRAEGPEEVQAILAAYREGEGGELLVGVVE